MGVALQWFMQTARPLFRRKATSFFCFIVLLQYINVNNFYSNIYEILALFSSLVQMYRKNYCTIPGGKMLEFFLCLSCLCVDKRWRASYSENISVTSPYMLYVEILLYITVRSPFFKGGQFCDFLFLFLDSKNLPKWSLLIKKKEFAPPTEQTLFL